MENKHSFEYTGKVLDKRNTLTGPNASGEQTYPELPKHVSIQQPNSKNIQ